MRLTQLERTNAYDAFQYGCLTVITTDPKYPRQLLAEFSAQTFVALELMRENASSCMYEVIYGRREQSGARASELLTNPKLVMLAQDLETTKKHVDDIFGHPGGPRFNGAPQLKGTTLAVVKPHAIDNGKLS